MSRLIKVSVFAIVLILLTGCSLLVKDDPVSLIEPQEIQSKLDDKSSFILVIGNQAQCDPCESYLKGGLRKLADNDDYQADYIMVDTIERQEDMDILTKIVYERFKEDSSQMLGVPSTYIIKDGEVVDKKEGAIVYEQILESYNQYVK